MARIVTAIGAICAVVIAGLVPLAAPASAQTVPIYNGLSALSGTGVLATQNTSDPSVNIPIVGMSATLWQLSGTFSATPGGLDVLNNNLLLPLSGQTIDFSVEASNGIWFPFCTAVTDSNGVGACSAPAPHITLNPQSSTPQLVFSQVSAWSAVFSGGSTGLYPSSDYGRFPNTPTPQPTPPGNGGITIVPSTYVAGCTPPNPDAPAELGSLITDGGNCQLVHMEQIAFGATVATAAAIFTGITSLQFLAQAETLTVAAAAASVAGNATLAAGQLALSVYPGVLATTLGFASAAVAVAGAGFSAGISQNDGLIGVPSGHVTVVPSGTTLDNTGTIDNLGTLSVNGGTVVNAGTIINTTSTSTAITNAGTIDGAAAITGNNYTLDFDSNGGGAVSPLQVYAPNVNSSAQLLPAPAAPAGSYFAGWFTSSGTQVTGTTDLAALLGPGPVTTTLHAHYESYPVLNLYVSPSGGSTSCGSSGSTSACPTIADALAVAQTYANDFPITNYDVNIFVAAGTYQEADTFPASGLSAVNIVGDGSATTVVDAEPGGSSSVFTIAGGVPVSISGLAIDDATATNGPAVSNLGGTVTLSGDTLANDVNSGGVGGAVLSGGGSLTLSGDTFSNDGAAYGAAVATDGGTVTATNDTFSNGSASTAGTTLFAEGPAAATLTDDTLSDVSGAGSGITTSSHLGASPTVTVADSILASSGCDSSGGGSVVDGGYNIESDDSCQFGATDSVNNSAIDLAPALATNGSAGPLTLAIEPGSSAYQAVPTSACALTADERGDQRPAPGAAGCDAGAFEYQSPADPGAPLLLNPPSGASAGSSFTAQLQTLSDGVVSVSSSTPSVCTVGADGLTVSFVGVGHCTLTPQVSSSVAYTAAAGVPFTFFVSYGTPIPPTVTNLPATATVGSSFTAQVSTNGDGPTSVYGTTPTCVVSAPYTVTFVAVGTCILGAQMTAGTLYASSAGPLQSFQITQGTATTPSITNLPAAPSAGESFVAQVSTSGDGTTSVSSSTGSICTVGPDGVTVSFVAQGICTLTPSVATGTNYLAATGPSQSVTVAAAAVAPAVTTQPSNQSVRAGQSATFTAAAGGSPAPTVQWQVSTDGGSTFSPISGATSGTYTVSDTTVSENRYEYEAVFTNSADQVTTNPATLIVTAPIVVPGSPTIGTVTAGVGSATVTWTAPASDGGSPINGYVVTPYIGSTAQTSQTFNSTALSEEVTGLTNGTAYTFTVAAINAIGTGSASAASSPVTPATTPAVPTIGTVTAGDGKATVSWSAPVSDGGSAITGYVVTPYIGPVAQPSETFTSPAVSEEVTGLTDGTAYTFTVAAINAVGTGPASAASSPVTVEAPATITSAATAYLPSLRAGSFTITTAGTPTATLTETGMLPHGLTFTPGPDGTATIAGTAGLSSLGTHTVTITATNGVGVQAVQTLTVVVGLAPALAAPTGAHLRVGHRSDIRFYAFGYPVPSLTVTGSLPAGMTFVDNGNGTATLAGTPATASTGVYNIKVTATNPYGTSTRTVTIDVSGPRHPAPKRQYAKRWQDPRVAPPVLPPASAAQDQQLPTEVRVCTCVALIQPDAETLTGLPPFARPVEPNDHSSARGDKHRPNSHERRTTARAPTSAKRSRGPEAPNARPERRPQESGSEALITTPADGPTRPHRERGTSDLAFSVTVGESAAALVAGVRP